MILLSFLLLKLGDSKGTLKGFKHECLTLDQGCIEATVFKHAGSGLTQDKLHIKVW